MKLDTAIIPVDQPALVAEVGQRRLGKYQVRSAWNFETSIANARTTMHGQPVDQPSAYRTRLPPPAADTDWGERDDGSGLRSKLRDIQTVPTSIRLAMNPTLAQEGDE